MELMNCMVAGCNSVKSTITKACDPTHHKGPTHCQAICARKVVVQVFGIIGTGLRCYTTGGVCVCVCVPKSSWCEHMCATSNVWQQSALFVLCLNKRHSNFW